jgi:aspartate kinase
MLEQVGIISQPRYFQINDNRRQPNVKTKEIFLKDPLAWKLVNEGVSSNNTEDLDTLRYELESFVCDGEYLNGIIMAAFMGAEFIDPAETIFFNKEGRFDEAKTYKVLGQRLKSVPGLSVIPGFYGCDAEGKIKTFPRGGSDITGAVVAAAGTAAVYENWTDVSGLLMADPTIVKDPKPMPVVTYVELRELSYMGANVLHDEALIPVSKQGIPENIRNTHDPKHPGTRIVASRPNDGPRIVGVAGKKGFTVISLS